MNPKPIELRPYQQDLVNKIGLAYKSGFKCPLAVLSTGGGKTVIFSHITHGASQKGNPVLVAAHRKEIIRQISLSLARFGVYHQVIAPPARAASIRIAHVRAYGKCFVDKKSTVIVGSTQTLINRLDQVRLIFDLAKKQNENAKPLIVFDEAHHAVPGTQHGKIMEFAERLGSLGLMVTATPCRLDGKGLGTCAGGYADTIVEGPSMEWLVNNGYLSKFRILTVEHQLDMSDVKKRAGEYISADLEELVNKPSITGDAVEHYKREASGKKAVVFCVSVAHSKEVASAFCDAGIKAAHIDGTTDDEIRDRSILDFADGKIDVLCQVNLFSEGFDLASIAQKDVTIDCLVDLAPTNSLVNAMQRWGRVLRPYPGKVAIILDHAGNTILRHGLPTTKRAWSLEGIKKQKRGENEKIIHCRCCPKCFTVHKPSPTCPNQDFLGTGKPCGHVYETGSRQIEERDGELVEIDLEAIQIVEEKKELRKEQGRAKTLSELLEIEKSRGYKRGWAKRVFESRK